MKQQSRPHGASNNRPFVQPGGPAFAAHTSLFSMPQGLQIAIAIAPQVNIVVALTIEQMEAALSNCRKEQMVAGLREGAPILHEMRTHADDEERT